MIVYIVKCPDTVFGEVVREFDSLQQAAFRVAVCKRNKVPFKLGCRFEDRPKQLEFYF